MTPDEPPEGGTPPNPETPPASLSDLRASRAGKSAEPAAKPGDLTPQLADKRPPKRGDLTQHLAAARAAIGKPGGGSPPSAEPPKAPSPAPAAATKPLPAAPPPAKPAAPIVAAAPPARPAPPAAAARPAAPPPAKPAAPVAAAAPPVKPAPPAAAPRPAAPPPAKPAPPAAAVPPQASPPGPLEQDEIDRMFEAAEPPTPTAPPPAKPAPPAATPRPAAMAPARPAPPAAAPPQASPPASLEQDDIDRMFEATEPPAAPAPPMAAAPPQQASPPGPLEQDDIDRMFEAADPPAGPSPPMAAPPQQASPPGTLEQDDIDRMFEAAEPPAAPSPRPKAPLMLDPGERSTVPPAPELRLVVDTPKADRASAPAPSAAENAQAPTSIDEIIDYWDGLRGDKPYPRIDQIDRAQISRTWPNCLLVNFGAADSVAPNIVRLGQQNGEIEYGEMVIHWILSRGRVAARRSEPLEEEKRFPVAGGGAARYQLLLLPLGTSEARSDYVLCHLCRKPEVSRGTAFKRWFGS